MYSCATLWRLTIPFRRGGVARRRPSSLAAGTEGPTAPRIAAAEEAVAVARWWWSGIARVVPRGGDGGDRATLAAARCTLTRQLSPSSARTLRRLWFLLLFPSSHRHSYDEGASTSALRDRSCSRSLRSRFSAYRRGRRGALWECACAACETRGSDRRRCHTRRPTHYAPARQ